MKKLITTLTLLLMFSSPSYAEWTKVTENEYGSTTYVDFDRIRKVDGFVYYWALGDLPKPDSWGNFSYKWYYQGDCKLFRNKMLRISYHTQPMGEGTPSQTDNTPDEEWSYPSPNSASETVLNAVCNR